MQDFSPEVVWKLEENYSDEQLIEALETLYQDQGRRETLGSLGKAYLDLQHDPSHCAKQYFEAIEHFYHHRSSNTANLLTNISHKLPLDSSPALLAQISTAFANTFTSPLQSRQLLIDITALINESSAITRSLMLLLKDWLLKTPPKILLEPIYYRDGRTYYARQFCLTLLGAPLDLLVDEPVQVTSGDALIMLGSTRELLPKTPEFDLFKSQGNGALYLDWEQGQLSLAPDCFHQHSLADALTKNAVRSISQENSRTLTGLPEHALISDNLKTVFNASFWAWINGAALAEGELINLYENSLSAILRWMDDQHSDLPIS
jgi:hypothetical protein